MSSQQATVSFIGSLSWASTPVTDRLSSIQLPTQARSLEGRPLAMDEMTQLISQAFKEVESRVGRATVGRKPRTAMILVIDEAITFELAISAAQRIEPTKPFAAELKALS